MRNYLFVLISIITLSVVALVILQPHPLIQFEAELSRLPPEEALQTLDEPKAYDPRHQNLTLLHVGLLRAAGEFEAAKSLLVPLVAALPKNASIMRQLSEIALLAGDTEAAIGYGEAGYLIDPQRTDREKLGLLQRLERNPKDEIQVLQSVPPDQLTLWEVDRLARLHSASGAPEQAEALYQRISSGRSPFVQDIRKRLVVFLIDDGRSRDALELMMKWYANSNFEAAPMETLLSVLVARGAIREASLMADRALELSPSAGHRLVKIFSRSGHRGIARRLQDAFLAHNDGISADEWETLVEFAGATGDLSGLQIALTAARKESIPTPLLADALLQMLRYQGTRSLIPFRQLATNDLIQHAPLIAAAFAVDQASHDATVHYLIEASQSELSEWDQAIWISIAERLKGTGYDRLLASSSIAMAQLAVAARSAVMEPSQ